MRSIVGFEPDTEPHELKIGEMVKLDSGWYVGNTKDYSNFNERAACFMRGNLLLTYQWKVATWMGYDRPNVLSGPLTPFSSCCGERFRPPPAYAIRMQCSRCDGVAEDFADPTNYFHVDGYGRVRRTNHLDVLSRRLAQHAGDLLAGELWRLDLEDHLLQCLEGYNLFLDQFDEEKA